MSARRLSIVIMSTLRGVLGVGGLRSALALGTAAETAGAVLGLGVAEVAGAGGIGSVLQAEASHSAEDNAEIHGNWARDRGTRAPRIDLVSGKWARTLETRAAFVEFWRMTLLWFVKISTVADSQGHFQICNGLR
jgi:hypothetical protein